MSSSTGTPLPFNLGSVQAALTELGLDGWLLYDFRGLNVLARRVLHLSEETMLSRRWFYYIPVEGDPRKLVHRIEPHALDTFPGSKIVYLRWQELESSLREILQGQKSVAMEYVPGNANPYVSRVDAGTIELVRSTGVGVVSSGDLVQMFEARWDDDQWAMHLEAARHTRSAFDVAFAFIRERISNRGELSETDVQACILKHFAAHGLVADHPPICAVGPHSGDPHYSPGPQSEGIIRAGDFVLIDLWGKLDRLGAVYSDLTWTAFVGPEVPPKYKSIFDVVAKARDAAIFKVKEAFRLNQALQGWEVDVAARRVIEQAGYGEYFCHRTGHSIGQETHGNGANMDNLETHEERKVIPRTCFSVEPGIYLPEFGVRSEVNVYVDGNRVVHVTGGAPQTQVVALLGNATSP
jgi:Xaa-Pro aminopeptidase